MSNLVQTSFVLWPANQSTGVLAVLASTARACIIGDPAANVMRRVGRVEEALAYAQDDMARLRGVLSYASRTYDAMLQDVVALLAYERAEVRALLR